jgi:hypothetical protein
VTPIGLGPAKGAINAERPNLPSGKNLRPAIADVAENRCIPGKRQEIVGFSGTFRPRAQAMLNALPVALAL